ncbi:MAG: porin [Cypionkella sp.]
MKKILLATTILAASTGFASAEVALSGSAYMGLLNDFGAGDDTIFISRARVEFTLSGETDGGLAFGASFRADNARNGFGLSANNGTAGSVYISGAFGKLSMGDVDGAAVCGCSPSLLRWLDQPGFVERTLAYRHRRRFCYDQRHLGHFGRSVVAL